jgi:hypothetical protein
MDERTRRLLEADDVAEAPCGRPLSERREFLQKAAGGVRESDSSTVSRML